MRIISCRGFLPHVSPYHTNVDWTDPARGGATVARQGTGAGQVRMRVPNIRY